jgi:hypothetical protein
MKEVTIKLYEFEELSEEIKAPLIAKQCKELEDDYCDWMLEDDMQEYASEILERKFDEGEFKSNNIYYDLSYTQGSGAMVEFEGWDIHILESILYGNNLTREWIDKNIANFILKVKHSGHYHHEYSFEFEEDLEYQEDAQTLEELGIEREEYLKAISEFIVDINKALYAKGKESVEWYWNEDNTRDEAIDRLSQYHYLEDGEVYLVEFGE